MLQFYLFRAIVVRHQLALFGDKLTTSEILKSIIEKKPSVELRKGYNWHIGNVKKINKDGIYFAFGKTTKSIVERYDKEESNFLEEEFDTSPYTHVICDLNFQVIAIARKAKLAPTPIGIARQLQRLFNSLNKNIKISPINDPEEFLDQIRSAYAITKFTAEFGLPNPWDANKDFQVPLQKTLEKIGGDKGKAIMSGTGLNSGALEVITRDIASAGHNVQAILQPSFDAKKVTKNLKNNPAILSEEHIREFVDMQRIFSKLRKMYLKIKNMSGKG